MDKVKKWSGRNAVVIFLFVIIITFSVLNSTFISTKNVLNILSQMSINALLATGITFVIITGGIDIGIGSVAAFAGIFSTFVGLRFPGMSIPMAILIQVLSALLIGSICGLIDGILIAKLRVVPMICTLAMMTIARGLAYVVTGGQPVYGLPNTFAWLGAGRIIRTNAMPQGIIPVVTIFAVIMVVLMHLLLTKTVFGRHVYAVGSNESVAHLSGINVPKTKILVYTICSVMAALGGVCVASKLNNGQPASCDGYEMYAIAATVLGGTSFSGGIGSVLRAMIGVAIIAIINNGLNLMQVSSYWQKVITGLIILFAVIVDMAQKKDK